RYDDVRCSFDKTRAVRERLAEKSYHGHCAYLVNFGFARQAVKKTWRYSELNAAPAPATHHHIEEHIARHARVCDDDLVRSRFSDCVRQSSQIADDGHALEIFRHKLVQRAVLHNSNHAIAQSRALAHLADTQRRFNAAPHDKRRYKVDFAL